MIVFNTGANFNDGTGDKLRNAFDGINSNTAEIIATFLLKESVANKTGDITGNLTSTVKYPTVKGMVDWATANIQGAPFLGSVVPTSTPTGTGKSYWLATQNGTYTNFGGVVVAANSFAVISRSDAGVFSMSQTTLNLTEYAKIVDINNTLTSTSTVVPLSAAQGKILNDKFANYSLNTDAGKIKTWIATTYLVDSHVNYIGKDWVSNAATVAGDVPGTSTKWVERLFGYNNESIMNDTVITKCPEVIYGIRDITFSAGILEVRMGKYFKSITFLSDTNFNLGVGSSAKTLVFDYTTSSLLVVFSNVIDRTTQAVLLYDNGTKIMDGVLLRFLKINASEASTSYNKSSIDRDRNIISDIVKSNRELSVIFSTLTKTPDTTVNFNSINLVTSTKNYTIDTILIPLYSIITIPAIIGGANDGYVFVDVNGKYLTGRTLRDTPSDVLSSGAYIDIVIPINAHRIIFAVLNSVIPEFIYYSKYAVKSEKVTKSEKSLYLGKDLFLIEGQDLPIYRRSLTNNSKVKRLCMISKDSTAKKSFTNIDYSLTPTYHYFDEKLLINTNTIKSNTIDLVCIFDKDPIVLKDNGIDYLYGVSNVNINKVSSSVLVGTTKDIMMIGGSTTNNGLATYTRKYISNFGITGNYKGGMTDDLGTSCEATDGWGSDTLFGKRTLVGSTVIYPHLISSPPPGTPNRFMFLATGTDKLNKPTFCYTFTSGGVSAETSYADYAGEDKLTRDFYIFSFSQYCSERLITNLDVMTVQLGINDINNNTYGLIDLQKFIPELLIQVTTVFPTIQIGVMPSAAFGAGTNGENFLAKYIPYLINLNLMVSTLGKSNVKVLSTQIHSDRINQFEYLNTTNLYSNGNLTQEMRTQGDPFHGNNNFYLEVGRAVGMYIAWASVN